MEASGSVEIYAAGNGVCVSKAILSLEAHWTTLCCRLRFLLRAQPTECSKHFLWNKSNFFCCSHLWRSVPSIRRRAFSVVCVKPHGFDKKTYSSIIDISTCPKYKVRSQIEANRTYIFTKAASDVPKSKVHGAIIRPTWVLSAPRWAPCWSH